MKTLRTASLGSYFTGSYKKECSASMFSLWQPLFYLWSQSNNERKYYIVLLKYYIVLTVILSRLQKNPKIIWKREQTNKSQKVNRTKQTNNNQERMPTFCKKQIFLSINCFIFM